MNKAIFFDRDGVINEDGLPFPYKFNHLKFYPNIFNVIKYLRGLKYLIIVVTNQPCVSRGVMTEEEVKIIHQMINEEFEAHDAKIDAFYFCPHHPDAKDKKYGINCFCRKPWPGMLLKAKDQFDIDLKHSWMIGDRLSDIAAGNLVGCKTVLCDTGLGFEKPIVSSCALDEFKVNYQIKNLIELKDIIRF